VAAVYILFSPDRNKYYVGSCKDLPARLKQHKDKAFENSYTASGTWELFFSVDDLEYKQAREIESHIKRMKSRTFISNLKKYPEIVQRLMEKYK